MSKEIKSLKLSDFSNWQKARYSEIVSEVNSQAAFFLIEFGTGRWYKTPTSKLEYITLNKCKYIFVSLKKNLRLQQEPMCSKLSVKDRIRKSESLEKTYK